MKRWCQNTLIGSGLAASALMVAGPAYSCSNVSDDGCPAVEEVDNHAASFTGTWVNSTNRLLYYGDDYRFAAGSGGPAPTATATFDSTVDTEVDGDYSVYARWAVDPNRCDTARFRIYDGPATLLATVTKDQRVGGGAWQRLGTYRFTPNNVPRVVLDNAGCAVNKYVIADGIRWVQEDVDHNAIVDEPGVEWAESGSVTNTGIGECGNPDWQVLRTITLTVPRSGYVLVQASGIVKQTLASGQYIRVAIDDASTGKAFEGLAPIMENESDETGVYENEDRFAISNVYSVSAGTRSFYLKGCRTEFADGAILWNDFTGIYFPTRY